jgi:AraC-like DNA-binding protein
MAGRPQVDTLYFSTLVGTEQATRLLMRAGLAAPETPLPEAIDMVDFWRCCAQNIQLTNDESHGVALEPVPHGSLSVLFTAAKEANDLGGALRRLVEAAQLVRRDCTLSLSRARGVLRLTVRAADSTLERDALRAEIYTECFAIVTHCALRWMTGRRIAPVRVRGAAALRTMGGELLNALHTTISRQGRGVSIDYDLADMALPLVSQKYTAWGEPEFASFVSMLEQDDWKQEAADDEQALILAEFAHGRFSQKEIAAALSLSTATLRRRLAASGSSFREISATYRIERLRDLLATDMPMIDIAERLGLSDERSLRRFCTLHLGAPPVLLRHCA